MNDRELDAQVAKHLFGWKKWRFINPFINPSRSFESLVPSNYDGSDTQHLDMIVPHYSTDPAANALVLDEIERQGWWWWGMRYKPDLDEGYYRFYLYNTHRFAQSRDDNRYRAVCLAVLAAIGEKWTIPLTPGSS